MTQERKVKSIALGITLLLCALVIALMLVLTLKRAEHEDRVWPPVDSSELLFDGEYVKFGDIPEPAHNDNKASSTAQSPDISGIDRTDGGTPEKAPAPVITSEQESPAKVTKNRSRKKPDPPKRNLKKRERETPTRTKKEIANRVKFGGTGSGRGESGKSGSPNGNADHGALSGTPGTSLKGRILESWARPTGRATGTIVVSVRVNRQGHVIAASYSRGTGAVAANTAARQSCVQAAKTAVFGVNGCTGRADRHNYL